MAARETCHRKWGGQYDQLPWSDAAIEPPQNLETAEFAIHFVLPSTLNFEKGFEMGFYFISHWLSIEFLIFNFLVNNPAVETLHGVLDTKNQKKCEKRSSEGQELSGLISRWSISMYIYLSRNPSSDFWKRKTEGGNRSDLILQEKGGGEVNLLPLLLPPPLTCFCYSAPIPTFVARMGTLLCFVFKCIVGLIILSRK